MGRFIFPSIGLLSGGKNIINHHQVISFINHWLLRLHLNYINSEQISAYPMILKIPPKKEIGLQGSDTEHISLPAIAYRPSLYKTSQNTVGSHLMVFICIIFWTFQEMYVGKSILFIKRNVYDWDSLKKQFSGCKWTQVVLRWTTLCLFLFFLIFFIPGKKKLDMIPLPRGTYGLVGDTNIN